MISKEKLKVIYDSLTLNKDDTLIHMVDLNTDSVNSARIFLHYADLLATLGRYRNEAERQVKRIRAKAEIEYRRGVRKIEGELKITDSTAKALVEADTEVGEAEDTLTYAYFVFNKVNNFVEALRQKHEQLKVLQYKEKTISKVPIQFNE